MFLFKNPFHKYLIWYSLNRQKKKKTYFSPN